MDKLLICDKDARGVATVTLNRADVHNAFNEELVAALTDVFTGLAKDFAVRIVVLTGKGKSFSAGADLNWMRAMAKASEKDNHSDALRLARMYRAIDNLPQPLIGRINGAAFGGGVGLIACCDMAVGVDTAKFGLTEVKLGLIPATIAPYVINAIGTRCARWLFTSAEIITAGEAQRIGFLTEVQSVEQLDGAIEKQIDRLLQNGPVAMREAKSIVSSLSDHGNAKSIDTMTSEWIARLRVSEEGQEGLSAFLEKRKPSWIPDQ